jgi:hypothetical protein
MQYGATREVATTTNGSIVRLCIIIIMNRYLYEAILI